jgi:dihydroorotase
MDLGYYDAQCHLVPPLRSRRDRDALRAGLADGTVDAICSDHTPVDEDEKLLPFGESTPGATGLELLLPLTLKWASESKLSFATALARITCDPARILGIAAGELAVGRAADVCVFDAAAQVTLTTQGLKSQGKNTPFLGYELPGKVRYTLVDGAVVYEG